MDKQVAYQNVRHHLQEWEQALARVDAVQAEFGAAGAPGPDTRTLEAGPPIGARGVEEIRQAENRALRQWQELQEAVERWNATVLQARPSLEEVLALLRAAMPKLQAEYGVTGLAVIGPYAKGDDYEAARLDLVVEYGGRLGLLKLAGLEAELAELLSIEVRVIAQSVLAERYDPEVLRDAVAV